MKENKFVTIVIIALFAINIFTLFRYYKLKQQKSINTIIDTNPEKANNEELNAYKINFKTDLLNSNIQLESLIMKDSLNNIIPLKKAFKEGHKKLLVYRFSQMHCESCVNASIQIFRNWAYLIGVKNILFLGNYRNNKIFYRTIPEYDIQDMKVYNVSEFNLPAENIGYPYCFVLDNNLQVSNVFVPNKGMPKITNEYLEMIQKKF